MAKVLNVTAKRCLLLIVQVIQTGQPILKFLKEFIVVLEWHLNADELGFLRVAWYGSFL